MMMAIFKCKMCGGTLKATEGATVSRCEYCGTQQTLPKLDSKDNNRINLYGRANHFRRNNEFDKAAGIYEQILNGDQTDAEAYWSLVLCRYGIEYVEDPVSRKRIPTVNRTQFTSIFDDDNYKSALKYADILQRHIYEDEAKAINEIQRGILAISQKEAPFDVFICYKESDNNGRRTPDSVLAQDLYFQLTQEGFKVFFSRITLEDKLGSAYEPYIFAALNSAKVMVVLGTKPEYFNAIWVKNEWSRYLSLIKQGQKKMLIPAYKDMDPYELPEEFSHLQAQDMSRLGFMQDLIRGIKKILGVSEKSSNTQEKTSQTRDFGATETFRQDSTHLLPLLKRAFIFLEDKNWSTADEYAEKVLDQDPENAQAYLCKLMAELRVKQKEALRELDYPFDENANYQKVLRYGDGSLVSTLTSYIDHINARNEKTRIENAYAKASEIMESADSEASYKKAAELFGSVSGYLNSEHLASECLEKAEIARKDQIYNDAKSKMKSPLLTVRKSAEELFGTIAGWRDADEQIMICRHLIEELKKKNVKLKKKIIVISSLVFVVVAAFCVIFNTVVVPEQQKKEFIAKYGQETYDKFGVVEKGKYIKFGEYEQDNNLTNGKEDIEWLVLEVKDGKALVVSKYLLDCKPFYKVPVYDGGRSSCGGDCHMGLLYFARMVK